MIVNHYYWIEKVGVDILDSYSLFPESAVAEKSSSIYNLPDSGDQTAVAYWAKCLNIIKDNVDKQAFKSWFEPIKAYTWEPNKLTVLVPSQFFYEWIETHYFSLLQKTIKRVMGEDSHLLYQVLVEENKESLESRTIKLPALKYPTTSNGIESNNTTNDYAPRLNPRYVFDNFITGDSNQLAYSAALAVSKNPGKTRYNPLFIYGDTGLGKTHLAQAIGNYAISSNPRTKVLYTNSELIYIDYIKYIGNNKKNEFVNAYINYDVLIVDDIQFLSGKDKTQDNFFHIFNALYQSGKQLVFTSDKPPTELKDVDSRLISRFQWGLIADVQPTDYEMRIAILKRKSEDEGIELPYDVIDYIARNVTTNVRELEGALISILAKVTFDRKPLNIDLAKEIVYGNGLRTKGPSNVDDIKEAVSEHFKITIEQIESKSRKHEITLARQMSIYLTKQLTELSLKTIGANFGGRDHSTVLHSCQAIENYLITDKSIKNAYEILINKLKK